MRAPPVPNPASRIIFNSSGIGQIARLITVRARRGPAAAALALLAVPAFAVQTIEVRITSGEDVFVHRQKVEEGIKSSFGGAVDSADGENRRRLIFNPTLSRPTPDGDFPLDYQLQWGMGRSQMVQSQTVVALRPGEALTVARCGDVSISLKLLGKASGSSAASPNRRLTVELSSEDGRARCSHVVVPGAQSNLVSALDLGETRKQLILNAMLYKPVDGEFPVQYQLELSRPGGGGGLEAQSSAVLSPGAPLAAVDCGGVAAALTLSGKRGEAAPVLGYLLTAEVSAQGERARCRLAVVPGSQSNLVGALTLGEARRELVVNVMPDALKDGAFPTQYQVELRSPSNRPPGLKSAASAALVPGRPVVAAKGPEAAVSLRLERAR